MPKLLRFFTTHLVYDRHQLYNRQLPKFNDIAQLPKRTGSRHSDPARKGPKLTENIIFEEIISAMENFEPDPLTFQFLFASQDEEKRRGFIFQTAFE